jgi:hypothetical protein
MVFSWRPVLMKQRQIQTASILKYGNQTASILKYGNQAASVLKYGNQTASILKYGNSNSLILSLKCGNLGVTWVRKEVK